jgi:hypothetical protein
MKAKQGIKKVERGALYLAGPEGRVVAVIPADGRKFTYDEQCKAVGGYVETMIPAVKGRTVYVNEEGALKNLPPNKNTWLFANESIYRLNGYSHNWRVAGSALEVFKVEPGEALVPDKDRVTVRQAIRDAARQAVRP